GAMEPSAELCRRIAERYPTPLALVFADWLRQHERLRGFATGTAPPSAQDVSNTFLVAFHDIWLIWRQFVHFLPFILMMSVRRLKPEVVRQHAGEEVRKAIGHFTAFYQTYRDKPRDKKETEQRELLYMLLDVFRKLDAQRLLSEEFFLSPLLRDDRGFADLFPARFDDVLQLFLQVRNKQAHWELQQRDPQVLFRVHRLLGWCLIDLLSLVRPLCEEYALVWVTDVDVSAA